MLEVVGDQLKDGLFAAGLGGVEGGDGASGSSSVNCGDSNSSGSGSGSSRVGTAGAPPLRMREGAGCGVTVEGLTKLALEEECDLWRALDLTTRDRAFRAGMVDDWDRRAAAAGTSSSRGNVAGRRAHVVVSLILTRRDAMGSLPPTRRSSGGMAGGAIDEEEEEGDGSKYGDTDNDDDDGEDEDSDNSGEGSVGLGSGILSGDGGGSGRSPRSSARKASANKGGQQQYPGLQVPLCPADMVVTQSRIDFVDLAPTPPTRRAGSMNSMQSAVARTQRFSSHCGVAGGARRALDLDSLQKRGGGGGRHAQ